MDKLVALGRVERLKDSDFVLENKMTERNQNKNSKQPNRPDAVWKLYFTLEINKLLRHVLQNLCSKSIRKFLEKQSS